MNDHAFGGEDYDPFLGACVDIAGLVDDDRTVGRAECGVAARMESPARYGVERHASAAHPYGLRPFFGQEWLCVEERERQQEREGDTNRSRHWDSGGCFELVW